MTDEPKKAGPSEDLVVPGVLCVSVGFSYGVFRLAAIFVPELRQRWYFEAPFLGAISAVVVSGIIAAFVYRLEKPFARAAAVALFIGLCAPWVFRLLSALWEGIRGAGI